MMKVEKNQPSFYCGICGKKVKDDSNYHSGLDVYFCDKCCKVGSQLSLHENVRQCKNCGFRFLPGFASWYYESDEPRCTVCGTNLTFNWTFAKLLNILRNPHATGDELSDAMQVFTYGRLQGDKGDCLQLSDDQKQQCLLAAIKSPYSGAHYKAYLRLKDWALKTMEVQQAILDYEKKYPEFLK
jgi:DNA-directed RNA polymerase subunit RPC12/RpoP